MREMRPRFDPWGRGAGALLIPDQVGLKLGERLVYAISTGIANGPGRLEEANPENVIQSVHITRP
jgi:hypothetical protein